MTPSLAVKNLSVSFRMPEATVLAVRDVSFSLENGRTLGLVGESGCGKSVTAYSILRLIAPPGRISSGAIEFKGTDLLPLHEEQMRRIRGREISMIFQEPMSSLNPVFRVGYQLSEAITLHLGKKRREARALSIELLERVGIPDAHKRYDSYPPELSGGMRQRVMIAMALSTSPSLLIADEPTTALDVTIQAQILDLLLALQRERNMSMLLITHDLGIVANIADSVAIMYAGEIMETGTVREIFNAPLHPYTKGLFQAIPMIGGKKRRLHTIPGFVPTITEPPAGCIFALRCPKRIDDCLAGRIPLEKKRAGHAARCIRV